MYFNITGVECQWTTSGIESDYITLVYIFEPCEARAELAEVVTVLAALPVFRTCSNPNPQSLRILAQLRITVASAA
jgi:hypothetical protein